MTVLIDDLGGETGRESAAAKNERQSRDNDEYASPHGVVKVGEIDYRSSLKDLIKDETPRICGTKPRHEAGVP
jgi:hypothetical protein